MKGISRDEVVKLYSQGKTMSDVGELLGCDAANIFYHLKKAKFKTRRSNHYEVTEMTKRKISLSNRKKIKIPKIDSKFSYWLGLLASDGCVNKYTVVLTNCDESLCIHWMYLGSILFGITPRFKHTKSKNINHRDRYDVIFDSIKLSEYLGNWSENEWFNRLEDDKFEEIIFKDDNVYAFLNGYFDGDGSIMLGQGKRIKLATKHKNTQIRLRNLYLILGIKASICKESVEIYKRSDMQKIANKWKSYCLRKELRLETLRVPLEV